MAVCDLMQSIFRVFPVLAAILADGLVLGKTMGHIQTNLMYITTWYTMLLTCALTTVKFAHLKYPFQARAWSQNTGHIISVALLGVVLFAYFLILVGNMLYLRDTLDISFLTYECYYIDQLTKIPSWFRNYSLIILAAQQLICNTILVVASILILLLAKKVRSTMGRRRRLEGTITVLLTVAVQFLSFLPTLVTYAIWLIMGVHISGKLWRAVAYAAFLNIVANFYIYCYTSRSFREFLKSKISEARSFLRVGHCILNKIRPA